MNDERLPTVFQPVTGDERSPEAAEQALDLDVESASAAAPAQGLLMMFDAGEAGACTGDACAVELRTVTSCE